MKLRTILQATKAHNVNQLHDQFVTAGLIPLHVESTETESRFQFEDSVTDPQIDAIVTAHTPQPIVPPNLKAKWIAYRDAVQAATTVAQIKTALVNDLGPLLREMAIGYRGDLQ